MSCLWLPGVTWMAALKVTVTVLSHHLTLARDTRPRFLEQQKGECSFSNGTEQVRYVARYVYNREEYVRFDSNVGQHQAVTELGREVAEYYNSQKEILDKMRAQVDTVCRHNYRVGRSFTVQRRGAQSEFVRGKMLSGIGGSVLGLLFLGVGLFIYFRNQKGHSGLQPTGLLS